MKWTRLHRYRNRERQEVWSELTTPGLCADSEIDEVISEVIKRVENNIQTLAGRLVTLGYKFGRPDGPYKFRSHSAFGEIYQAEHAWGRFPRLVRRLYERFEFIDFSQHDCQISEGKLRGMGYYPQLYFLSLNECAALRDELARAEEADNRFMMQMMRERGETWTPEFTESFLPLGPCASNNSMIGFTLPCETVDATCYDDGGGPVTFLEHLRHVFECGGFPQLKKYIHYDSLRTLMGMDDPQSVFEYLTHGLEPI